ncbi:hypothetical protein CP978_00405 [Streptomyces nodosus]|uniref:Uncharacterized protein n=1 Tax=Streptomyces nodosus TaxID=40318 RepID=A0A5P2VYY6_9ACTN|nr:hypothetical protein CP978_00405 [Streptomyces nodosus]
MAGARGPACRRQLASHSGFGGSGRAWRGRPSIGGRGRGRRRGWVCRGVRSAGTWRSRGVAAGRDSR